jgi:hypothetical protein
LPLQIAEAGCGEYGAGNSPEAVNKTQQACIWGVPEATAMKVFSARETSTRDAATNLKLFKIAP